MRSLLKPWLDLKRGCYRGVWLQATAQILLSLQFTEFKLLTVICTWSTYFVIILSINCQSCMTVTIYRLQVSYRVSTVYRQLPLQATDEKITSLLFLCSMLHLGLRNLSSLLQDYCFHAPCSSFYFWPCSLLPSVSEGMILSPGLHLTGPQK